MRRILVSALALVFFLPSVATAEFRDVPASSPHAVPVRVLERLGVIGGFGDGTFRPAARVTRAEYLKMLYRATNRSSEENLLDDELDLPFTDVDAGAWYAPYVRSAYVRGVTQGVSETEFAPNRGVTLFEAAKMLVALEFQGVGLADTLAPADDPALAQENIGAWVRDRNLVRPGIRLDAPLPRGDVADLLYRWMVVKKTASARYDQSLDARLRIVPIAVSEEHEDDVEWLKEALDLIEANYLGAPSEDSIEAGIRGVVDGLGDPYSAYYTGEETEEFLNQLNATDVGIGVLITIEEDALAVARVMPDSPAARAGIVAGDRILAIDGAVVADDPLSAYLYLSDLRTPGQLVTLDVQRLNGGREQLRLALEKVAQPTAEGELLDGGVLSLRIWEFAPATGAELGRVIEKAGDGIRGVLLDLRGNPGGLVSSAWDVGAFFLPEGSALAIMQNPKSESVLTMDVSGPLRDLPVVVLVDGGSASAAEIVAAALRDNNHATLVGEQTYGKGTVQALLPVGARGVLRLTVAEWLTSTGASVHELGLKPNAEVPASPDDFAAGRDPQREEGLRLLQSLLR